MVQFSAVIIDRFLLLHYSVGTMSAGFLAPSCVAHKTLSKDTKGLSRNCPVFFFGGGWSCLEYHAHQEPECGTGLAYQNDAQPAFSVSDKLK